METWLAIATKQPGPPQKQGYGNVKTRVMEGIVGHSMEGSLAAALGELNNPNRQASWTFSNPKAGPLLQHYPLEAITWASGSQQANIKFLAIESEGVAGELLNPNQVKNMQDLMNAITMKWERKATVFEHKEMTAYGSAPTACPSNRYPWTQIIGGLDMTKEEMIAVLRDPNAFPELQGKSLVGFLQVVDNYQRSVDAQALKAAAKVYEEAP